MSDKIIDLRDIAIQKELEKLRKDPGKLIKWIDNEKCLINTVFGQATAYKPIYSVSHAINKYCMYLISDPVKHKNKNYSTYKFIRHSSEPLRTTFPKLSTEDMYKIADIISEKVPRVLEKSLNNISFRINKNSKYINSLIEYPFLII